MSSPEAVSVDWPRCSVADCVGAVVGAELDAGRCLAHTDEAVVEAVLKGAATGEGLDCRGVSFTNELTNRVAANAFADPNRIGLAYFRFDNAIFPSDTDFELATFGRVSFHGASFGAKSSFAGASFPQGAIFSHATFGDNCSFERAEFLGRYFAPAAPSQRIPEYGAVSFKRADFGAHASFAGATIGPLSTFADAQFDDFASFVGADVSEGVRFDRTRFGDRTTFDGTRFSTNAHFDGARFGADISFANVRIGGTASFVAAVFRDNARLGPLVCSGPLVLARTSFEGLAEVLAGASEVSCRGMKVLSGADFRIRCADLDLQEIRLSGPSTIASASTLPLELLDHPSIVTAVPPEQDSRPYVRSLRGADARNLVLADVDLSSCEFFGSHNLDQLRLEGTIGFRLPPGGLRRGWAMPPLWYWSRRRVIVEEHYWRATTRKGKGWRQTAPAHSVEQELESLDEDTLQILRSTRDRFEAQFRCRITDEALNTIIEQAGNYFPERDLPDKAVELLDQSCRTLKLRAHDTFKIPRQPPAWYRELEDEIEQVRKLKEAAIEAGAIETDFEQAKSFEKAASLRDKERKLSQRKRELEEEWLQAKRAEGAHKREALGEYPDLGPETVLRTLRVWAGRADASEPFVEEGGVFQNSSSAAHEGETTPIARPAVNSREVGEIYRALRKGREDNRDAPGAADFYYGEMEMRRHAANTPWGDRVVVWLYWALSGYGLRATRALLALGVTISIFGYLFASWGFAHATHSSHSYVAGVIHSAESATFFARGTDRPLTQWGQVFQTGLRVIGPALLALAVLSLRGRTKR